MRAKKRFRQNVLGRHFKIVTGDKNLKLVSGVKNPSSFTKIVSQNVRSLFQVDYRSVELYYMQILSPAYRRQRVEFGGKRGGICKSPAVRQCCR